MKKYAATPEQLRVRNELRRSGAAGTHGDRRQRRNRTRQTQKARAMRDAG